MVQIQRRYSCFVCSEFPASSLADDSFFDGWQALAMTLLKQKKVKEAIGCGIKATTLQPNDLLAWTGLSQMYVQDGQIAEAEHAKGNARILSMGGKVTNLKS